MNQLILRLPVSVKIALAPLLVMLCLLAVALQSFIGNSQTSTQSTDIEQGEQAVFGEVAEGDGEVVG